MTLNTLTIDTSPHNIATMMQSGHFHSHTDGKWRYSPHGAPTVYCNDPTEQFDKRGKYGAYCSAIAVYAQIFSDGTRGLTKYDAVHCATVWQIYGPSNAVERAFRAWLLENVV